jgi:nitrogen fixation protein NifQ
MTWRIKMGTPAQFMGEVMEQSVNDFYLELKKGAAELPNTDLLARMLASHRAGEGELPERLGLSARQFPAMISRHFPRVDSSQYGAGVDLALTRIDEREELRELLLRHGSNAIAADEQAWIADIIIAACMGGNHLWQDLGLWSRKDLSALINLNFPALAQKNDRDMKWKKFLYKQLCNAEGIYTCRAPSCEVCDDFNVCFGSEE